MLLKIFFPGLVLLVFGGSGAVMGLAGLRVVTNPERLLDVLILIFAKAPSTLWNALDRVGKAAFDRMFGGPVARPAPPLQLEEPAAINQAEPHALGLLLVIATIVGWVWSAPKPARPPTHR